KPRAAAAFKPWRATGDVTVGAGRVAISGLDTTFDSGAVEGGVTYAWPAEGRPARLEADLRGADIDLDGALALGDSALAGLGLEWPGEMVLALEAGRARIAGLEARNVAARLTLDAEGLAIQRLSVEDLGDASFIATGRLRTLSSPGG